MDEAIRGSALDAFENDVKLGVEKKIRFQTRRAELQKPRALAQHVRIRGRMLEFVFLQVLGLGEFS